MILLWGGGCKRCQIHQNIGIFSLTTYFFHTQEEYFLAVGGRRLYPSLLLEQTRSCYRNCGQTFLRLRLAAKMQQPFVEWCSRRKIASARCPVASARTPFVEIFSPPISVREVQIEAKCAKIQWHKRAQRNKNKKHYLYHPKSCGLDTIRNQFKFSTTP